MPNRARNFSFALVAAWLAAAALTAGAATQARAADECLTAPKGPAPQGSHWYYRIERTTKRHCWYSRAESPTAAQASAVPDAADAAPLQPAIANARAELPPSMEPLARNAAPAQPSGMASANAAPASAPTTPSNQDSQGWTVASRWSDQASADAATGAVPAMDNTDTRQRLQSAATKRSAEASATSLWTLIGALVGALALAGLATAAVMAFGKANRRDEPADRRSANWGVPAGIEPDPVEAPEDPAPMNWIRIAREIQEADHRGHEIEELLSRAPRRPAA